VRTTFLLFAISLFAVPSAAQRHIEFDGLNVPRTVKVPKPIVRLLHDELQRNTELSPMCHVDASTDVSSWFSTSRIDLGERARAYLLTPERACLDAIDHTRFWIARKTPHGYKVILQAGAIVLDALKTRTHGLRDLETNACTAAFCFRRIYKFNASLYETHLCSEGENGGNRTKFHRVPCRQ